MPRQKPGIWVKGLKNSPRSTRTREQDLGLFLNDSGSLEPIDDSWKTIAQGGCSINSTNKLVLRADTPADRVEISSPAANNLLIDANGVAVSADGYTPDGTLHVYGGSAGSVAADDAGKVLVVEQSSSTAGGISILTADNQFGNIYFGSPSDNVGAALFYRHADSRFTLGTSLANGSVAISSGEGTTALVIDGDQNLNASGNRTLNSATVNDAIGGHQASFSFDGTDDYVGIGHDDNIKPTHSITVSAWANAVDWTDTTSRRIFSNTQSGGVAIALNEGSLVPSGNVGIFVNITTTGYISAYTPTSGLGAGWHHFVGIYDGRYVKFYVDGVLVSTTDSGHDNRTIGQHASNSTFIGAEADAGTTPSGAYFDGQISQVRIHNRALSAAEVRAAYNGQAVPFEYRGASQDDILTNGSFTGNATGWLLAGTAAYGTDAVTFTGDGTADNWIAQTSITGGILGKTYRLTYEVTANSLTGTGASLRVWTAIDSFWLNSGDITSTVGTHSLVVTTNTSGDMDEITLGLNAEAAGGTLTIDNISLTQIGCVAEYLPESISDNAWLDSSGNELDGTVSGATAVNAESGIVGRDSHLVESKTVADLQSGASFNFDGVTGNKVALPVGAYDNIKGSSSISASAWVYRDSDSGVYDAIVSCQVNGAGGFNLLLNGGDDTIFWQLDGNSTSGGAAVSVGQWHHVVGTFDGTYAKTYLDGVLQVTSAALSGVDFDLSGQAVWIGAQHNGGGSVWNGQISQVRLHNRALSAAEVRASYNGQAVGYEYRGASQDELVVDGDLDPLTGWGTTEGTSTPGQITWTATSAQYVRRTDWVIEKGKSYRLTVTTSAHTADGGLRLMTYGAGPQISDDLDITGTGTHTLEFVAQNNSDGGVLFGRYPSGGTYAGVMTDVSCVQIGCVAEYLPESISDNAWLDSSGNELDGSVSGATAVNAESGIVARDSHLLESKTVADLQSGASFNFDGVSGNVICTDTQFDVQNNSWSAEHVFTVSQYPASGPNCIASIRNTNIAYIFEVESDGSVRIDFGSGAYVTSNYPSAPIFELNRQYNALVTYQYVSSGDDIWKLYVDGVLVTQGTNAGSGINLGATGKLWLGTNATATGQWFNGTIGKFRYHNRALSAAEVRAAYNGQAVPYEYRGASQTAIFNYDFQGSFGAGTTNNNFSDANYWGTQANADSSTTMDLVATGANQSCRTNTEEFSGRDGQAFRITYDASDITGSPYFAFASGPGAFESIGSIATGTNQSIEFVWNKFSVAVKSDAHHLYIVSSASGDAVTLDNITITQIGCVAEYLPSGINATQWVDTSGNGLHGTTSTATAVNHEVGAITATGVVEVNNGIKFPNTQVASADANTLDDYEEGTWTPAFPTNTLTGTLTGHYTKVGNMVTVSLSLTQLDWDGAGSDHITISGLPFESADKSPAHHYYFPVPFYNVNVTGTGSLLWYLANNSDTLFLYESVDASANVGVLESAFSTDSTSYMRSTFTYFV